MIQGVLLNSNFQWETELGTLMLWQFYNRTFCKNELKKHSHNAAHPNIPFLLGKM